VLARYPRLRLGEEFIGYFADQAQRKPLCLAAKFVHSGFAARALANPLDREARHDSVGGSAVTEKARWNGRW
jgi:hypothetical protein